MKFTKKIKTGLLLLLTVAAATGLNSCVERVPQKKGHWELVWNDEFNGTELDRSLWTVIEKRPGWVNQEEQAYVDSPENVRVEDGKLIIQAHKRPGERPEVTSARLDTYLGGKWTYGRFEINAKLAPGKGTWPAIFMLPSQNIKGAMGWPTSGEIDIMEQVGYLGGKIHGSIHCADYNHPAGTHKQGTIMNDTAFEEFHTYGVDWYPDRIDFFVDDNYYFTFENEMKDYKSWPFYKDFFLILNMAIGGSWGGIEGVDDGIFPATMEVDWVRVYQADLEKLGYDMTLYNQD